MLNNWVLQPEITVIDKPEYYFALDLHTRGEDEMVFIHLVVHIWSPSVYKEVFRNWALFRQCVTCPIYATPGVEDVKKWEAFVTRLGFKFLTPVTCVDGAVRRLFVHYKEEQEQHEPHFTDHK